jgi:hypothetical protein
VKYKFVPSVKLVVVILPVTAVIALALVKYLFVEPSATASVVPLNMLEATGEDQ